LSLFRNYKKEFEELLAKYEELDRNYNQLVAAGGDYTSLAYEIESKNREISSLTTKLADLRNEESDLSILVYSKQSELKKIEESHSELLDDYHNKAELVENYEGELVTKRALIEATALELSELMRKLEVTKVAYEEYDKGITGLREEESTKKENLVRLQKELEEIKYNKEKYSNLEVLKVRYDEVYEKVQDILKERAELDFELRDLEQIKKKLSEDINRMRNDMLAQRASFEQHVIQERISVERDLIKMKQELEEAITTRQNQLSIVERDLNESKIRYSKLAAAVDELIQELDTNEKKLEMVKIERDNLLDEATSLNRKVESLSSKASSLDTEVQSLNRQVDRLNDERQTTSGLLEQIKGSIQGLTGSKEAIIENITRLNQQLAEKSKAYSSSYEEYQQLVEHIQGKKIEAVNLKGLIELRSRKLKDTDRELSSLEALRDEYETDLKQILDLQRSLSNDLSNSQEDVEALQDTLSAIRKKFSEIIKIRKARQESARREKVREEEEEDYQEESSAPLIAKKETAINDDLIKALYADNDRLGIDEMAKIFVNSNVELTTAESGTSAFDSLKSEPYDLAFFDMDLPGMAPLEIIERMRSSNVYKTIPIFAVLEAPDERLSALALEAGATNILYKPFSSDIILTELKKYLPV
jgi:CheY-like chemotaxis protein/predicted  nucleic acid-binding Zn-ribbon protein